jgi:ArsR family transcriptional regulator, arsenate/arsenite/antimonite-responsive transcriptional repressor
MEPAAAITAFAALAQPTRLETFRLLVRHEPRGLPAGEIAQAMGAPANTMSAHLAVLHRAGLVTSERRSRSIIYRAELGRVQDLAVFLMTDCCQGQGADCGPVDTACDPVAAATET